VAEMEDVEVKSCCSVKEYKSWIWCEWVQ